MVSESAPTAEPAAQPVKPVDLRPQKAERPTKVLPTTRISFSKQIDLLRAYGAASSLSGKAVTRAEVAGLAGIKADTVTLANAFFVDAGFITKNDSGLFTASPAVRQFAHDYQWQPESAIRAISAPLRTHWAFMALEPRLKYERITERAAIQVLSAASQASTNYTQQLSMLLDFVKISGLVEQDAASMLQLGSTTVASDAAEVSTGLAPAEADDPPRPSPAPTTRSRGMESSFSRQPESLVQFGVSVRVDMAEMGTWSPERIAAFFAGVAQVMTAKAKMEASEADAVHRDGS